MSAREGIRGEFEGEARGGHGEWGEGGRRRCRGARASLIGPTSGLGCRPDHDRVVAGHWPRMGGGTHGRRDRDGGGERRGGGGGGGAGWGGGGGRRMWPDLGSANQCPMQPRNLLNPAVRLVRNVLQVVDTVRRVDEEVAIIQSLRSETAAPSNLALLHHRSWINVDQAWEVGEDKLPSLAREPDSLVDGRRVNDGFVSQQKPHPARHVRRATASWRVDAPSRDVGDGYR